MGDSSYETYGPEQGRQRLEQDDDAQDVRMPQAARTSPQADEVPQHRSRESILRSYAAQDAARARNARIYSQAATEAYKESSSRASERAAQRAELEARLREQEAQRAEERRRRAEAAERLRRRTENRGQDEQQPQEHRAQHPVTRVVPPLSSQESYDRARSSQESYERARASRDVLSASQRGRTPNRDIIDGRGSIDSRAFDETHELLGYSIDERDRPDTPLDASFSGTDTRWRSHAEQDAGDSPAAKPRRRRGKGASSDESVGTRLSGSMMGGDASSVNRRQNQSGSLSTFVTVAVIVIVVLVIVLVILLVL